MSQQRVESASSPAEQPHSDRRRVYTAAQVRHVLQLPRSTFFRLLATGQLPFLEELRPRLGRAVRYRADLVDRFLSGEWGQSRSFASARRFSGKAS